MSNKIVFLYDSATILSEEQKKQMNAVLIPLTIIDDKQNVYNDVKSEISSEKIIDDIANGARYKTSMAPIGVIVDMIEKLSKEYDHIVYFPIGKGLSSQFAQVKILENEFSKLVVLDCDDACASLGWLMVDSWNMLQSGKSINDVIAYCEKRRPYIRTFLIVDNLMGLILSGRISKKIAAIGKTLSIKPIILYDRTTQKKGMGVGLSNAIKNSIKIAKNELKIVTEKNVKRIHIYTGMLQEKYLKVALDTIKSELKVDKKNVIINDIPTVILVHTLKNSFGLFVEVNQE